MCNGISLRVFTGIGCLLAWSVVAAEPIDAELLRRFAARTFTDAAGPTLRYRLFVPEAERSQRRPLVMLLHGAVGRGDDNEKQFAGGNAVPPRALTSRDTQSKFPCLVFAPQCPKSDSWVTAGGEPSATLRRARECLESLTREHGADTNRLYLIGLSMGGSGAWGAAAHFTNTFAAVVPICGAGETSHAVRLVDLPIWCFHGASDPLMPVDYARRMIAAVRARGGHPKYTEYPGVGHNSYENAFREPEFLPWLFAQDRSRTTR